MLPSRPRPPAIVSEATAGRAATPEGSIHQARARWRRIRSMSRAELVSRIASKLSRVLSPKKNFRRVAFHLNRLSLTLYDDSYVERAECGPRNLEAKLDRLAAGGPFEPYSVTLVNRACGQLIGPAESIFEVGAGTGMFASIAARESRRKIVASEFDEPARTWAIEHRSAPNVQFTDRDLASLGRDEFELVVAIEVIEHVTDFGGLLRSLTEVAPRAIITTPNKFRSALDSVVSPPEFDEHVREWSAGEFFWVLRGFYDEVTMYTLPNMKRQVASLRRDPGYEPHLETCGVHESDESLIADCRKPNRAHEQST